MSYSSTQLSIQSWSLGAEHDVGARSGYNAQQSPLGVNMQLFHPHSIVFSNSGAQETGQSGPIDTDRNSLKAVFT